MQTSLTNVGPGHAGVNDVLVNSVRELQNGATRVVNGAAANTAIVVPGLTAKSTVLSVIGFNAGVPYEVTASVGNADGLRFDATSIKVQEVSTGHKLLVRYVTKP